MTTKTNVTDYRLTVCGKAVKVRFGNRAAALAAYRRAAGRVDRDGMTPNVQLLSFNERHGITIVRQNF